MWVFLLGTQLRHIVAALVSSVFWPEKQTVPVAIYEPHGEFGVLILRQVPLQRVIAKDSTILLLKKMKCQECELTPSTLKCVECEESLCANCDRVIHSGGKRKSHIRNWLCACANLATNVCERCHEGTCTECQYLHAGHILEPVTPQKRV